MKSFLFFIKYSKYNTMEYCIVKIDNDEYTEELNKEAEKILKYTIAKIENSKDYLNNQIQIYKTRLIKELKYNDNTLINATKTFIYKDYELNDYVIRKLPEPDISIFNYLFVAKAKIFIIGNHSSYINKDNLDVLEKMISRYIRVNNIDTSFFNLKNNKGELDLDTLEFVMDKSNTMIQVIILEENISFKIIERVSSMKTTIPSLYALIRNGNNFYRITPSNNSINIIKARL